MYPGLWVGVLHTFALMLVPLKCEIAPFSHLPMCSSLRPETSGNLQDSHVGLDTEKYRKVTGQLKICGSTDTIGLILNGIYSTVTVLLISTELKAPEHFVNDVWHGFLCTDRISFPPA